MTPELLEYFDSCLLEAARVEFANIGAVVVSAKTYYMDRLALDLLDGGLPTVGYKVRYVMPNPGTDRAPVEGVGLLNYVTDLTELPASALRKVAEHLAKSSSIRMASYAKDEITKRKPLPIRELTAQDREDLCLPF